MFLHFEAVTPVLIHRKRCQKVLVCRLKWKTQQKTNRKHVCFMDYYGCLCVLPEHVPAARHFKSFRLENAANCEGDGPSPVFPMDHSKS